MEVIDYDHLGELTYYGYCFNETLRLQPPVTYSSLVAMTNDVKCGDVVIRKSDMIAISMHHLCNNPNEWIDFKKFIPERFDSDSPYFLTPSGKRRNPFSFSPFLGGSRICLGKSFVENTSRLTVPTLLSHFDFNFEKGVNPEEFEMPSNNLNSFGVPYVRVRLTRKTPTYFVKP